MAAKDLDYYLKNPDEMPTEMAEVERLANEHMANAMKAGNEEMSIDRIAPQEDEAQETRDEKEKGASSDATAFDEAGDARKEESEKPEATTDSEKPEEKTDDILARDGKNLIPYSQLESARQRATEAERLLAEQIAEVERLTAGTTKPAATPDVDMLTEEELSALEEDSPTLAKVLRAQQSVIKHLNETVGQLAERSEREQAEKADSVKSEVQQAIDATPELAAWQTADDQTMWDRAAAFDKALRERPEYKDVAFADRFRKVVALTKTAFDMDSPSTTPPAKPAAPEKSAEEMKAAAKEKLSAATRKAIPTSLSDIPGGAPPAVDEQQKLEQMSPIAIGNMLLGMTPEQRDAYLSRL